MNPFIGEIRLMGFDYAPKGGWLPCDGTLLPKSRFGELFALIGTKFGGDSANFALPNLNQGRIALGTGAGPSLTPRAMGDSGGFIQVALTTATTPGHTHLLMASSEIADVATPTSTTVLARANGGAVYGPPNNLTYGDGRAIGPAPGGHGERPHDNLMPYQAVLYCIYAYRDVPAAEEAATGHESVDGSG